MEHLLMNTLCVILTTKITVRGTGHKAKPARRDGKIVGVWPNGQMLIMLLSDGTLEKHDFDNVALIKDAGSTLLNRPTAESHERMRRIASRRV